MRTINHEWNVRNGGNRIPPAPAASLADKQLDIANVRARIDGSIELTLNVRDDAAFVRFFENGDIRISMQQNGWQKPRGGLQPASWPFRGEPGPESHHRPIMQDERTALRSKIKDLLRVIDTPAYAALLTEKPNLQAALALL